MVGFFNSFFSRKKAATRLTEQEVLDNFFKAFEPLEMARIDNPYIHFLINNIYMPPIELFKESFILLTNETEKPNFNVVEYADINNGEKCGYFTQGFCLWLIEQKFKNSKTIKEETGLTFEDFIEQINSIYGNNNEIINTLGRFRNKFDDNTIHPTDWVFYYIYGIYDLLILNKEKNVEAINSFDRNPLLKIQISSFIFDFILKKTRRNFKQIKRKYNEE